MITTRKLKFLKAIKIIVLIIYIPFLLFYIGILIPEYLAYLNCVYEGDLTNDIWGNEIHCYGENKYLAESIFQLFSIIFGIFTVVLLLIFYLNYTLKKALKKIIIRK